MDARPLWVQLYWGKDQREGRFVLQNAKLPKVSEQMNNNSSRTSMNVFFPLADETYRWKLQRTTLVETRIEEEEKTR